MNTVALILAIVALGVSIAALVITLKRKPSIVKEVVKETLIEPQSDSNLGSNEVQMKSNQTLNGEQVANGSITSDGYPFTYSNGTFKMDGNLKVTGGITCLNKKS
jgi:hypothetical protein